MKPTERELPRDSIVRSPPCGMVQSAHGKKQSPREGLMGEYYSGSNHDNASNCQATGLADTRLIADRPAARAM